MIDISEKLKEKIKIELGSDIKKVSRINYSAPSSYYFVSSIFFKDDEEDIYNECIEWIRIAKCHLHSFDFLRAFKIGRFNQIRPESYFNDCKQIRFSFNNYDKKSWKDWFEIDESSIELNGLN